MESSILMELSSKKVISENLIANLRAYIASKNSFYSQEQKTAIFINALNRVILEHLPEIGTEDKERLKQALIKENSGKGPFVIDYSDILKTTLNLKLYGNVFFREMSIWLNKALNEEIDKHNVFEFILSVYREKEISPLKDIGDIIKDVEAKSSLLTNYSTSEAIRTEYESGTDSAIPTKEDCHEYSRTDINKEIEEIGVYTTNSKSDKMDYSITAIHQKVITEFLNLFSKGKLTHKARIVFVCIPLVTLMLSAGIYYNVSSANNNSMPTSLPEADKAQISQNSATTSLAMKATAYDLSIESCGKSRHHPLYGITRTGTRAEVGRTVAVDPSVIPLGSKLYITFPEEYSSMNGIYYAEDTGNAVKGDIIDIFLGEDTEGSREVYNKAMKFGIQKVTVKLLTE